MRSLVALCLSLAALLATADASAAGDGAGRQQFGPGLQFLRRSDIGIRQGLFQRHGLDVQVIDLEGSSKLHQAMVAGAIDFGLGAGTDIAFLVKGAPEIGVGAIALTPALFGIIVARRIHQSTRLPI